MKRLDINWTAMLQHVGPFVHKHKDRFAPGSAIWELVATIEKAVAEVNDLGADRHSGWGRFRDATKDKSKARAELQSALRLMTDVARLIERTIPGTADRFKPVRGESDAAILHGARTFAQSAVPLSNSFIRYSMPATFIEDLKTLIRTMEEKITEQAAAQLFRKSTTSSTDIALKRAKHFMEELDVVLRNEIGTNTGLMAQWKVLRHVQRVPRKRKARPEASESAKAAGASG